MQNKYTILIDTREKTPLIFGDIPLEYTALAAGDYSLKSFSDLIAIERKSLPDLVQCVGKERTRFTACLMRLSAYKCKAVIVEATLNDIFLGDWRGEVKSSQVLGSISSWQARFGVPFIYAGNPILAADECKRLMFKYADYLQDMTKRFEDAK